MLKGHKSDCAVYNMPAYPNGECDCGKEGLFVKALKRVFKKRK